MEMDNKYQMFLDDSLLSKYYRDEIDEKTLKSGLNPRLNADFIMPMFREIKDGIKDIAIKNNMSVSELYDSGTMLKEIYNQMELIKSDNFKQVINYSIRLINIVEKRNDMEEGTFANMYSDLYDSVDILREHGDEATIIAFCTAQSFAACGLYLQGIFDRDEYSNITTNIMSTLLDNEQNSIDINVLKDAQTQALEFIQSYDKLLSKEVQRLIVIVSQKVSQRFEKVNKIWPYEAVVQAIIKKFQIREKIR